MSPLLDVDVGNASVFFSGSPKNCKAFLSLREAPGAGFISTCFETDDSVSR